MSFIVIREYPSVAPARMDAAMLQGSGIEARLQGDNVASINPMHGIVSGIRLLVPEDQAERAASLLGGALLSEDSERCPKCGSTDFALSSRAGLYFTLFLMFASGTLFKPAKKLRCKECGNVWRAAGV